jgi:nucleoside-diphosphate-sugar epimerase
VGRYFFASSACVYNVDKQARGFVMLSEEDAYPALPEDGYGWEKLFSERMCLHFREDFGLQTRVARFNNVYGPYGAWIGGREKAPAAMCRKVIQAKKTGKHEIEIWGDGTQTRSFTYVDDCVRGIIEIARSNICEPINLSAPAVVSINEVVTILEQIAGIKLVRQYKLDAPKGVQGLNSDTAKMRGYLGWEPDTPLRKGLSQTYEWIYGEYLKDSRGAGNP